jgi:hypothetical protein
MPHVLLRNDAHRQPPEQVAQSIPGCIQDGRQGFGEQVPEPWSIPP